MFSFRFSLTGFWGLFDEVRASNVYEVLVVVCLWFGNGLELQITIRSLSDQLVQFGVDRLDVVLDLLE